MEQTIMAAALAISMGIPRADVLESLRLKGLSPEDRFLVYQAATIMAKDMKA